MSRKQLSNIEEEEDYVFDDDHLRNNEADEEYEEEEEQFDDEEDQEAEETFAQPLDRKARHKKEKKSKKSSKKKKKKQKRIGSSFRYGKECVCGRGGECQGVSAAFSLMEDPRRGYVQLPPKIHPDELLKNPSLRDIHAMRASYLRHLRRSEASLTQAAQTSLQQRRPGRRSSSSSKPMYVALHHFHPVVVQKHALIPNARAPIPKTLKKVDLRYLKMTLGEEDRVRNQDGKKTKLYYFCPNYPFAQTKEDLKRLIQVQKIYEEEQAKREARRRRQRQMRLSMLGSASLQAVAPMDEIEIVSHYTEVSELGLGGHIHTQPTASAAKEKRLYGNDDDDDDDDDEIRPNLSKEHSLSERALEILTIGETESVQPPPGLFTAEELEEEDEEDEEDFRSKEEYDDDDGEETSSSAAPTSPASGQQPQNQLRIVIPSDITSDVVVADDEEDVFSLGSVREKSIPVAMAATATPPAMIAAKSVNREEKQQHHRRRRKIPIVEEQQQEKEKEDDEEENEADAAGVRALVKRYEKKAAAAALTSPIKQKQIVEQMYEPIDGETPPAPPELEETPQIKNGAVKRAVEADALKGAEEAARKAEEEEQQKTKEEEEEEEHHDGGNIFDAIARGFANIGNDDKKKKEEEERKKAEEKQRKEREEREEKEREEKEKQKELQRKKEEQQNNDDDNVFGAIARGFSAIFGNDENDEKAKKEREQQLQEEKKKEEEEAAPAEVPSEEQKPREVVVAKEKEIPTETEAEPPVKPTPDLPVEPEPVVEPEPLVESLLAPASASASEPEPVAAPPIEPEPEVVSKDEPKQAVVPKTAVTAATTVVSKPKVSEANEEAAQSATVPDKSRAVVSSSVDDTSSTVVAATATVGATAAVIGAGVTAAVASSSEKKEEATERTVDTEQDNEVTDGAIDSAAKTERNLAVAAEQKELAPEQAPLSAQEILEQLAEETQNKDNQKNGLTLEGFVEEEGDMSAFLAPIPCLGPFDSDAKLPETIAIKSDEGRQMVYDRIVDFEETRCERFFEGLRDVRSFWRASLEILQAGIFEVARAERLIRGAALTNHAYGEALHAMCQDVFLDDDGNPTSEGWKQNRLKKERATQVYSIDQQVAKQGDVPGRSPLLDGFIDSQAVMGDLFSKSSQLTFDEVVTELTALRRELKNLLLALKRMGDVHITDMRLSENEVLTAFSAFENVGPQPNPPLERTVSKAVSTATVQQEKPPKIENRDSKRRLLGIFKRDGPEKEASPTVVRQSSFKSGISDVTDDRSLGSGSGTGGSHATKSLYNSRTEVGQALNTVQHVKDRWFVEVLYRAAVNHQAQIWEKRGTELSRVMKKLQILEMNRRIKLHQVLLDFVPRQRRLFLSIGPIPQKLVSDLVSLRSEPTEVREYVEEILQKRQEMHLQSDQGYRSIYLNRSRASEPDLEQLPVGLPGDFFDNGLLRAAKVVSRKIGKRGQWKPALAVVTIDKYLHLFDVSMFPDVQVGNDATALLSGLLPEVKMPTAEDEDIYVRDFQILETLIPEDSFYLANCMGAVAPRDPTQLEIHENGSRNSFLALRTTGREETQAWLSLMALFGE